MAFCRLNVHIRNGYIGDRSAPQISEQTAVLYIFVAVQPADGISLSVKNTVVRNDRGGIIILGADGRPDSELACIFCQLSIRRQNPFVHCNVPGQYRIRTAVGFVVVVYLVCEPVQLSGIGDLVGSGFVLHCFLICIAVSAEPIGSVISMIAKGCAYVSVPEFFCGLACTYTLYRGKFGTRSVASLQVIGITYSTVQYKAENSADRRTTTGTGNGTHIAAAGNCAPGALPNHAAYCIYSAYRSTKAAVGYGTALVYEAAYAPHAIPSIEIRICNMNVLNGALRIPEQTDEFLCLVIEIQAADGVPLSVKGSLVNSTACADGSPGCEIRPIGHVPLCIKLQGLEQIGIHGDVRRQDSFCARILCVDL